MYVCGIFKNKNRHLFIAAKNSKHQFFNFKIFEKNEIFKNVEILKKVEIFYFFDFFMMVMIMMMMKMMIFCSSSL